MLVPVVAAAVFFFVFYSFLNSRPKKGYGQRVDRSKNRLVALVVSLVVLVLLWWLLIYLASTGVFAGARGMFSRLAV